jgi:uncharacterized protein YdhG (YjbR/CyaY superfamily)
VTSTAATVNEYFNELPTDRRAGLERLRVLIHRIAPRIAETMQYGMPTFGDLCALASQKHYLALYVCEGDIVQRYVPRLGKVDCGKGCIRFKHVEDLNLAAVEDLLRAVLALRKKAIHPASRTRLDALLYQLDAGLRR